MNVLSHFATTKPLCVLQEEIVDSFDACTFEPTGFLYEHWMDAQHARKTSFYAEDEHVVAARAAFVNQNAWTCSAYDGSVCVFHGAISVFVIQIYASDEGHVVEVRRLDGCEFAFSAVLAKLSAHFKIVIPGIIRGIDYNLDSTSSKNALILLTSPPLIANSPVTALV